VLCAVKGPGKGSRARSVKKKRETRPQKEEKRQRVPVPVRRTAAEETEEDPPLWPMHSLFLSLPLYIHPSFTSSPSSSRCILSLCTGVNRHSPSHSPPLFLLFLPLRLHFLHPYLVSSFSSPARSSVPRGLSFSSAPSHLPTHNPLLPRQLLCRL